MNPQVDTVSGRRQIPFSARSAAASTLGTNCSHFQPARDPA
jgi:hypothetical protein